MSSIKSNEYTLTYKNMRGVDFSAPPSERTRYAYTENMYRDYDGDGSSIIESVPGFRKLASLGKRIRGIYTQTDHTATEYVIVHAADKLYRFKTAMRDRIQSLEPLIDAADSKSIGFSLGYDFYLIDSGGIIKIDSLGEARRLSAEDEDSYIPTTYFNAEPFEQKNLMTRAFRERYVIGAAETVTYGTHGLLYGITSEEKALCAVIGVSKDFIGGIVNIPSYTRIGDKRYKVYEISDNAFIGNEFVNGVKIGMGVYRIGKYAFKGCTRLASVFCSDSVAIIDTGAFVDCSALSTLHFGLGTEKFGSGICDGSTDISMIRYSSDLSDFKKIENHEYFDGCTVASFSSDLVMTAEIPVMTKNSSITSVTMNEEELSNYSTVKEDGIIKSIIFTVSDRRTIEGAEIVINGKHAYDEENEENSAYGVFAKTGYTGGGFVAIIGCTVVQKFDGRVFLSGNPDLPGTVFFSGREDDGKENPLYFGAYNFFCDGIGGHPITAMLASADSLAVFKKGDSGGGSIFYHTPKETGNDFLPRIYPVTYTHSGIGAIGKAISFFDDPVFISKMGLSALDKKAINLERSIACRSHNVNSMLLRERLDEASLAEWCGYLAVGVNGHIYLADSRATFTHESGYREYEWFYLTGIGTYEGGKRVYRYASTAPEGYGVHSRVEEITDKEIYSEVRNSQFIYYTVEDGEKYCVYLTEEVVGGSFHPMTVLASAGEDLLFFGTDNGDLCVFNNDKRGIAPPLISDGADFSSAEYASTHARKIHPHYYTFDDHAMRCGVRTARDDCSVSALTKNTAKNSLTLKCALSGAGRIRCEVATNRSGYTERCALPNQALDFSDLNFDTLTLDFQESVVLPIKEKEKSWIEKEISVYCEDFRCPIGIDSISYRFTVKGKLKYT